VETGDLTIARVFGLSIVFDIENLLGLIGGSVEPYNSSYLT